MAIKSLNEITLDFIDYLGASLPDADSKPGTVIRDLFIDLPASQLALVYNEISNISNLQSLRLVSGTNLERLAQNLGAVRKDATSATGIGLFTFSSLNGTVGISPGDVITSQGGASFSVITGVSVDSSKSNYYRSVATKYASDLSFLGITDPYAVEVSLRANTAGSSGNISKYSLVSTSISGVSNITNTFPFSGGNDQENDTNFRNRVLSIFSGSNIGTSLGYRNTALTVLDVQDALVISPGDPLMTRDGTITSTDSSGNTVIVSEGTGNKVDVVILGINDNDNIDTFIYRDQSNSNDPTSSDNDFILGQITGDAGKTISKKRIDDIKLGVLPSQPIENITEVSGSLSGGNFIPKTIDGLGRISGNYELVKDTGVYAGSPWAQDYFHWVSNQISNFPEDLVKTQFNGQDATSFTDVLEISTIQQNINITNENSNVLNSDRSIVQLLHTPVASVSRVLNTNTGERYTVTNQNLDATSPNNTTGRIQISGNTLPSSSDILQVDYIWVIDYDPFSDYDGKIISNNPRSSVDSIDWGLSNVVRNDRTLFTLNGDGSLYTGFSSQPISSVVSANVVSNIVGIVSASSVINFSDRLAITLSAINIEVDTITSIKIANSEKELYTTAAADGLFFNNRIAVGTNIRYNVSIILPTDTDTDIGDFVEITYNAVDVFNTIGSSGSFVGNIITIPEANIIGSPANIYLDLNYIASSPDLLSYGITNMPISRFGNGYSLNDNTGGKTSNISNCIQRQNATVQKNISNQYYVKLTINSTDYSLSVNQVVTVIDISSHNEYWNSGNPGTITMDTDGNYLLIFSGVNAPAIGDQIIAIFSLTDNVRTQPFTFSNKIIKYSLESIDYNFDSLIYTIPLNTFVAGVNLPYKIIDPSTGISIASGDDGYISTTDGYGLLSFSAGSFDFTTITNLSSKIIVIDSETNLNDNGNFYPLSLNSSNSVQISPLMSGIFATQISVIRLSDNKDIWDPSVCTVSGNTLILPKNINANNGDAVIVMSFISKAIHQSPTRLAVTLSDQLTNTGVLSVYGTTFTKVADVVFTATQTGLQQNVLEALRTFLGLSSTSFITSDKSVIRILKLDKVETTTNDEVISIINSYDVVGSTIRNDLFYPNEMNYDGNLSFFDFKLPSTINNTTNTPSIGDKLKISFAYSTSNDSENLYFSRNGTLYTNKKFAVINKIFASSGFNSSQSARFTVSFFTQPSTGTRYRAFYNYLAPKQNERIIIRTNFNQAILDATFAIESFRPINADVLVRAAKQILVDATVNIVVKSDYATSSAIVIQNVKDKITNAINTGILGDDINSSDLVVSAQGVDGVDRARVLTFNKDGVFGTVLTLVAPTDSYFSANNIVVAQESR